MHQKLRIIPSCKQKQLDKYYTKPAVVTRCLAALQAAELMREYDCIIEPAAGAGAFCQPLRAAFPAAAHIAMDIAPDHADIMRRDWLHYQIPHTYRSVLVVGNPPFGQYHKLSTQFLQHALLFGNVKTIAFILPQVYKKHTRQKILPYDWRIASITELGDHCFTLREKGYHIPSSFFVMDRSAGVDLRVNPYRYTETNDFKFGNKNDFDIFVFGAAPNRITKTPRPNNRGYYLKSKIAVDELARNLRNVTWRGNSCASGGVYWLTKYEFLEQYIAHHG